MPLLFPAIPIPLQYASYQSYLCFVCGQAVCINNLPYNIMLIYSGFISQTSRADGGQSAATKAFYQRLAEEQEMYEKSDIESDVSVIE